MNVNFIGNRTGSIQIKRQVCLASDSNFSQKYTIEQYSREYQYTDFYKMDYYKGRCLPAHIIQLTLI